MSGGSLRKAPTPHTTIGCQELLSTGDVSHSGTLKKQLTYRNRASFIGHLVSKLPWAERYVVLSQGSLYHYADHLSKKPSGAYSLYGYNQIVRAGDVPQKHFPWVFKIVHISDVNRVKYFASFSEKELKTWMREIHTQLVIANGSLISQSQMITSVSDEDLERPLYNSTDELTTTSNQDFTSDRRDDEDGDSDADDYLEIDENTISKDEAYIRNSTRPLPPTPSGPTNPSSKKTTTASKTSRSRIEEKEPDMKILNLMNETYTGEDEDDDGGDIRLRNKPLPKIPNNNNKSGTTDRPRLPTPAESKGANQMSFKTRKEDKTPDKPWSNNKMPVPPSSGKLNRKPSYEDTTSEEDNRPTKAIKPVKFGVNIFPGSAPPPVAPKPKPQPIMEEEPVVPSPSRMLPVPPPRGNRSTPSSPPSAVASANSRLPEPAVYDDQVFSKGDMKSSSSLIRWNEVYWDGADKQACEQIIRSIGIEGVYMVRQSERPGIVKTLVCYADGQARKFMIKQGGDSSYYIKEDSNFTSIIALLEYYHQNKLPNRSTCLIEPYTKHTRDSF